MSDLPLPPLEYRRIVGPTDPVHFDNPTRKPVFGQPDAYYDSVLDFGCGCGRLARQLIQQRPRPKRYIGIDCHRGMIDWCRTNLAPRAPGFEFHHHDVLHPERNPGGTPGPLPFPAADREATLVIAWSIFTHLLEADTEFYLGEVARVLQKEGAALTSWFLFDKGDFPMMQEFQNALMINPLDLTNAVIFDKPWVEAQLAKRGLVVTAVSPPRTRGFQWTLQIQQQKPGRKAATFPEDLAARGLERPPLR